MIVRFGIVVLAMTLVAKGVFAYDLPPIRLSPSTSPELCEHGNVRAPARSASAHSVPVRNVNIQTENWTWQMFPDGYIYPSYLAATQNRLGGVINYDERVNWIWDITLGGRAPLFRYGNRSALFPEGWQLDMEGSVHLRLALKIGMDMEANDFRFGLPLSYGTKVWQVRTGYYHVSSHMGDERVLRYLPDGEKPLQNRRLDSNSRFNYWREAWLLSFAYQPIMVPNTRFYAEVDYAFMTGELTKPWHFQFGAEYSPRYPAQGGRGTPFAAINARLMQEHNFDGNITTQIGWQWRGSRHELFRIGLQYFAGVSDQYSFLVHRREHKIGMGVWYDF
ncbi:MAG: DUF1207 domain-containing protein [Planctomycetaceae bacterium]|nr:DUF1207 domain-containing protein [Planctomycetaceae bacterium]